MHRRAHRLFAVLLTLSSSVSAQPKATPAATKQAPPPALSGSLNGEAKADYEAAKLLYVSSDYAGALVKFRAAHDKSKDPRLLWNMAACEKQLRHYTNLVAYVRRYLAEGGALVSEPERAEAEALLKASEALTAALDITVNEAGARVFVDDTQVGESPLSTAVVVDVGARKIRIEKQGFEVHREELTVGGSPRIKLTVTLEKVQNEANLVVYTAAPLDPIVIDGTLRGLGTWTGTLPSGSHTLRVATPEMRPYETVLVLRDKESRTVALALEREAKPKSARVPTWIWIGGAALVATGIVVAGIVIFQPEDKAAPTPIGTLDPGSVQASVPMRALGW